MSPYQGCSKQTTIPKLYQQTDKATVQNLEDFVKDILWHSHFLRANCPNRIYSIVFLDTAFKAQIYANKVKNKGKHTDTRITQKIMTTVWTATENSHYIPRKFRGWRDKIG